MTTSRDQLREFTRARVLAAADELFRTRGFNATTIRHIAQASGVSAGTVMASGDKQTILIQVFDGLIAHQHAISRPASPEEMPSCTARLLHIVRPFAQIFAARLELARAYAAALATGAHPSALYTQLRPILVAEMSEAITAQGCTTIERAPAIANALYLSYSGALITWSARAGAPGTADQLALVSGIETELHEAFTAITNCKEMS